jgi:hypothetical protein
LIAKRIVLNAPITDGRLIPLVLVKVSLNSMPKMTLLVMMMAAAAAVSEPPWLHRDPM